MRKSIVICCFFALAAHACALPLYTITPATLAGWVR